MMNSTNHRACWYWGALWILLLAVSRHAGNQRSGICRPASQVADARQDSRRHAARRGEMDGWLLAGPHAASAGDLSAGRFGWLVHDR